MHDFTERLVNPRPVRKESAAPPAAMPRPAWEEESTQPPPGQQASRARAIFDASEEAKPFDPADFDFAMADEDTAADSLTPPQADSMADESLPAPAASRKRTLGMTPVQLAIVAALGVALLIVVAVLAYVVLTSLLP